MCCLSQLHAVTVLFTVILISTWLLYWVAVTFVWLATSVPVEDAQEICDICRIWGVLRCAKLCVATMLVNRLHCFSKQPQRRVRLKIIQGANCQPDAVHYSQEPVQRVKRWMMSQQTTAYPCFFSNVGERIWILSNCRGRCFRLLDKLPCTVWGNLSIIIMRKVNMFEKGTSMGTTIVKRHFRKCSLF